MIEVFKTNVQTEEDAKFFLEQFRRFYPLYKVNFDLDDCDHILRVECPDENLHPIALIRLLTSNGFYAEILQEDGPSDSSIAKDLMLHPVSLD